MNVVRKPLSELHPIDKNIRRHPEKQIKEYVRSIEMHGQLKPIVVTDSGEILVGNGLFYALQSMGASEADCYVLTGLTEVQKKKVMLSDNRVYELGFTDTTIFDEIIRDLEGDIDVPGWDADLLEMLNASVRDANEMVNGYGVYGENDVNAVNSRERTDHSDPTAAAPAPAGPPPGGEGMPPAPSAQQRVITCPHCGEQICL